MPLLCVVTAIHYAVDFALRRRDRGASRAAASAAALAAYLGSSTLLSLVAAACWMLGLPIQDALGGGEDGPHGGLLFFAIAVTVLTAVASTAAAVSVVAFILLDRRRCRRGAPVPQGSALRQLARHAAFVAVGVAAIDAVYSVAERLLDPPLHPWDPADRRDLASPQAERAAQQQSKAAAYAVPEPEKE